MPLICIIVVFGQYSYIRMWVLRESVGEIRWIRGTTVCMGTSCFKCAGDTRGGGGSAANCVLGRGWGDCSGHDLLVSSCRFAVLL